ncbi:DNA-deoxyinosine glycosylase [Mycolicibacterium sp. P1-18]|uniref:DNA-deoxyinosine glycosylase n=1 Tax=Mycolicibacterium sp. P1-18 TaxID=2024615 RepID=UPI0011F29A2C|nr:DNA-deoxyinosine glycosylase [Mycolicibacterium sp. P1-18]KAA0095466.1 DNA-deoxyinosine glycosylase [Mycolicibacterium sp. P1-18]
MTEPMREGLPPVVGEDSRVLILGSFPSECSLVAGEYYANRRNQFWQLMAALHDVDVDLPYRERVDALTDRGVALWDVVHSCRRAGSLDAKIDKATLTVNDFGPLFARHPGIRRIFVNGLTAFDLFEAKVQTELPAVRLPSSSGALPMSFADKLDRWREVV